MESLESPPLLRADSWQMGTGPQLLKTTSNAQEPGFLELNVSPVQAFQTASLCPPPASKAGKPPLPPSQQQASLSTASTHTATGAGKAPGESPPAPSMLPMRQVSLDAITAADLCGSGPGGSAGGKGEGLAPPDRSSIFYDVIEQLAAKEENLPMQTGLYTLPSIQFLESLLEDMDSKVSSGGHQPPEPPLYLPLDAFDLPDLDSKPPRALGPSPFELCPASLPQQQQQVFHISAAATLQEPVAQPAPHHHMSHHHHGGLIPTSSSMPLLGHGGGFRGSSQLPHSRSAGPSPAKPPRQRAASMYADYDYDDQEEMLMQMSKGGRMRKVNSYSGAKRKVSGEICLAPRSSLHDPLAAAPSGGPSHLSHHHHHSANNTISESDTGATVLDDESDEEVSKSSKRKPAGAAVKKGGKRTTCLNCGCHQTPQWRCGPLGPRTLCNACGVRYKKGLPLNCWPIREGMVLPPGAVLPPGVHIPGVILQPADDE